MISIKEPADSAQEICVLYQEHSEIEAFFIKKKEISHLNSYTSEAKKSFLLACASYLESKLLDSIRKNLNPSNCPLTKNFLEAQLNRRFHTLFDWSAKNNVNGFLSKFGNDFKKFYSDKEETEYEKAFISIISDRNTLIHNNYVLQAYNKTVHEIHVIFTDALKFIEKFSSAITEFQMTKASEEA